MQKYEEYLENDFINARFNILIKRFKKPLGDLTIGEWLKRPIANWEQPFWEHGKS
ncbi:hypothetical protein [Negadavirga shengliensis]|uniref:Uncharacterized protein n=1 Tax=Negadavirga shengliensis TaxID=1389218 RepID=A0ABV9SYD7_9BACT